MFWFSFIVIQTVPFIFVLMNRKTEEAYRHLFQYIEVEICSLKCASFMTDFELAMRCALKSLYPESSFNTCWFHFCQCARRRVAKNSALAKLIQKNEDARRLYKKCLALPLLPCNEIVAAFKILKAEALAQFSKEFHPFMTYFEKQWIEKVTISIDSN